MDGKASLREDVKEVLVKSGISTEDIQNLSVSALAARVMSKGDAKDKAKLRSLLEKVQSLKSESPPQA